MQTALVSAPLASTPPQHTPSRPRKSSATNGVVAFRSTDSNEVGSYPRGSSSVIESGSWRSGIGRGSASLASAGQGQPIAPTRSIPKSASYVKVEGFEAPGGETTSASTSPPLSPGKDINRASSLLSRQLSVENISILTRPTPASSSALASLAERLEAQVQAESAVKPASVQSRTAQATKKPDNTLLKQLQGQFAVFREPLVMHAFSISRAAHQLHADNPRGEAAFARCAGAAVILAELGADEVAVAGALLHDALDRTMFSEPQLRDMLRNDEAFELVQRVSHMGYICQKYRGASNSTALKNAAKDPSQVGAAEPGVASHLVGMLVAHGPPRALLVRLAVALQEARAVDTASSAAIPRPSWGSHAVANERAARRQRIAAEGLEVWAPLANRLGVWSLKAELEDRAFRTLRPAEYAELRDRLEAVQEPTKLVALVDALRSQLQEVGVEYLDLSGRPKHLWGVFKKMETKGYSAERVRDVRGLRVIVKTREDCYLALRAVEKAWEMVGESKNYIKAPKANGYQSLHAVADPGDGHLVEIQIRTDKMHYLAEYGAEAAHWKYKERAVASSSSSAPSTGSGGGNGAAREANWAKFMTSQHVLLDKKCRPSGSPNGDQSLASILASMEGVIGGSSPEDETPTVTATATATAPGTSPGSSKGRTFQEYIAASGQRPTPPEEQRSLVAVVAGTAFSVAELPVGTTVGQLLKYCGADFASSRSLHVVVNRHVETEYSTVLQPGDVVELYADNTATVVTSTSAAPSSSTSTASGNVMAVGSLSKKLRNADLNRAN
jgi:GTP pyrophosphokinase